jgi:hypothetical protein
MSQWDETVQCQSTYSDIYSDKSSLVPFFVNPNYRGQETKWNPALDSLYLGVCRTPPP